MRSEMNSKPLTQVECVLHSASPAVASLPHVVDALSALLDFSASVSLPAATASGSVRLLERVATRLLNAETVKPALRAHLFARAMKIAIKQNDLPMVQQIHSLHAEPLDVASMELAVEHSSLELVQWVVTHRRDQSCCSPGLHNLCPHVTSRVLARVGPQDALRVVRWLLNDGHLPLSEVWGGSVNWQFLKTCVRDLELLRWLVEDDHLKPADIDNVLWLAIEDPDSTTATVRFLVEHHLANQPRISAERFPPMHRVLAELRRRSDETEASFVTSLLAASLQRGKEETVEFLLTTPLADSLRDTVVYAAISPGAAKVLQWLPEVMDDVARNPGRTLDDLGLSFRATHYCHVETLRWLHGIQGRVYVDSRLDSSVREQEVLELLTWMLEAGVHRHYWPSGNMDQLASHGFLTAVKWLHSHGLGGVTMQAMNLAAANGHLQFIQWLHETQEEDLRANRVMRCAAGNGRLDVVKWLHGQGYEDNTTVAMTWAAVGGHVDVLEWLYENRPDGCVTCALRGLLRIPRAYVLLDPVYPTFPVLNTLQWLEEHQPTTPDCQGTCLPALYNIAHILGHLTSFAAGAGNMTLLEYLHDHHRDEFALNRASPRAAATAIVRGGCVTAVQWLFDHHHGSFDWDLVMNEARVQSKRIAAWLEPEMAGDH